MISFAFCPFSPKVVTTHSLTFPLFFPFSFLIFFSHFVTILPPPHFAGELAVGHFPIPLPSQRDLSSYLPLCHPHVCLCVCTVYLPNRTQHTRSVYDYQAAEIHFRFQPNTLANVSYSSDLSEIRSFFHLCRRFFWNNSVVSSTILAYLIVGSVDETWTNNGSQSNDEKPGINNVIKEKKERKKKKGRKRRA